MIKGVIGLIFALTFGAISSQSAIYKRAGTTTNSNAGSCAANPYLINSEDELRTINDLAPTDGTKFYAKINKDWVTECESGTTNYRYINFTSNTNVYLDLGGHTIERTGTDRNTSMWFHVSTNSSLTLWDSVGSGKISCGYGIGSDTSSRELFYASSTGTINIYSGTYEYKYLSNYSGIGFALQAASGSTINIYGGAFYAPTDCISTKSVNNLNIYAGEFNNNRPNQTSIFTTNDNTEKFSTSINSYSVVTDGLGNSVDLEKSHIAADSESKKIIVKTTHKEIAETSFNENSDTNEVTINSGEEFCINIWVVGATKYRWSLSDYLNIETEEYMSLYAENVLYIHPDIGNLKYNDIYIHCDVTRPTSTSTKTDEYTIHLNVNRSYQIVTFDDGEGHTTAIPNVNNKSISGLISNAIENEQLSITKTVSEGGNNYSYYLVGYAPNPLSYYENDLEAFKKAADELYSDTTVHTEDMTLYAAWIKVNEFKNAKINSDFTSSYTLPLNDEWQDLGEIQLQNIPVPAFDFDYDYTPIIYFEDKAELVNQNDATDKIPLNFYYGNKELVKLEFGDYSFDVYDNENNSLTNVSGEQDFLLINGLGNDTELNKLDTLLKNKVVLVYRGFYKDYEKANKIAAKGAKAIIIIEPTNTYTPLDLSSYTGSCPVGLANINLAEAIEADCEQKTLGPATYYEGKITVSDQGEYNAKEITNHIAGFPLNYVGGGLTNKTHLLVNYDSSLVKEGQTYTANIKFVITFHKQNSQSPIKSIWDAHELTLSVSKEKVVTLDSISLSGDYKQEFDIGETFNHDGLVVTAHYMGQEDQTVTDYEVSTPDMTTVGVKEVVVTYSEGGITKTASYSIIVKSESVTLTSISLSGDYKTEFTVGDSFSAEGLVVTAHYSDGSEINVTLNEVTFSGYDMSVSGLQTVTVTYQDKTAKYQITVNEKTPEPPADPVTPTDKGGLSGGAIAGIVIGSALVVGIGGFTLVWFVIKKKKWADFLALFKKK